MATRKWLENWLVWMVVDVGYVAICVSQRLYAMAALYAVFLVLAVLGYKEWRASSRAGGRGGAAAGHGVSPARVVLIGPECTGKTRLACDLAGALRRALLAGARARVRRAARRRALGFADVDAIGRGQQADEDEAIARAAVEGAPLVLLDTDLVSTMIYSRHYYDDCPALDRGEAVRRLADLYLLHDVDVEWVGDGHQREQPERREELFVRFKLTLELLDASVAPVAGDWNERRRRAIDGDRPPARAAGLNGPSRGAAEGRNG